MKLKGLFLAVLLTGASHAATVSLTFDELSAPADGLTVKSVTFSYTLNGSPSDQAHYGAYGPGESLYISDPSLLGNPAGILGWTFAHAAESFEFGVGLNTSGLPVTAATVSIFDSGNALLAAIPVTFVTELFFLEAKVSYAASDIRSVSIDFDESQAGLFAVDNLIYSSAAVPEPSSWLLTACGAGLVGAKFWRRRRA